MLPWSFGDVCWTVPLFNMLRKYRIATKALLLLEPSIWKGWHLLLTLRKWSCLKVCSFLCGVSSIQHSCTVVKILGVLYDKLSNLGHSLSRTQITSFGETRNRKLVIDRPCDTQITETKLVIAFFWISITRNKAFFCNRTITSFW